MNFNLMSGLMAGSNAGLGFFQGMDQGQEAATQAKMQSMALLMNQMKLQDEQRNLGYGQAESDYARQIATDPDTMDLPVDKKMDLLTNKALETGDLVRANELATNAANFRATQATQEHMQALANQGRVATQQKLHDWMGSDLAAAADQGPEAFNKAKMIALSSGEGTPYDQKMLANLQWQKGLGDRLRMGAMTARQQMQTQAEQ